MQTCLCLISPSPSCVRHTPKPMRALKIPYPSVIQVCRTRTHSRWYRNTRTMHKGGGGGSWVAPYYGCWLSPEKAAGISRALHWDYTIISTLLDIQCTLLLNLCVRTAANQSLSDWEPPGHPAPTDPTHTGCVRWREPDHEKRQTE